MNSQQKSQVELPFIPYKPIKPAHETWLPPWTMSKVGCRPQLCVYIEDFKPLKRVRYLLGCLCIWASNLFVFRSSNSPRDWFHEHFQQIISHSEKRLNTSDRNNSARFSKQFNTRRYLLVTNEPVYQPTNCSPWSCYLTYQFSKCQCYKTVSYHCWNARNRQTSKAHPCVCLDVVVCLISHYFFLYLWKLCGSPESSAIHSDFYSRIYLRYTTTNISNISASAW